MVPNEEVSYELVIEDEEIQVENEEALAIEVEEEAHFVNGDLQDSNFLMPEWDTLALKEDSYDANVGSHWEFSQYGTIDKDITIN